jgi:hypothetical protein
LEWLITASLAWIRVIRGQLHCSGLASISG